MGPTIEPLFLGGKWQRRHSLSRNVTIFQPTNVAYEPHFHTPLRHSFLCLVCSSFSLSLSLSNGVKYSYSLFMKDYKTLFWNLVLSLYWWLCDDRCFPCANLVLFFTYCCLLSTLCFHLSLAFLFVLVLGTKSSDFDVLGRLVCEESASSPHFACGFVSIPLGWSLFGSLDPISQDINLEMLDL